MKNPGGRWTTVMASSMITAKLAAVNLVINPAARARLPNDSPMITRSKSAFTASLDGDADLEAKIVLVRTKVKGRLIQRLTVPFNSDRQRKGGKEGNLPELGADHVKAVSFQQDA